MKQKTPHTIDLEVGTKIKTIRTERGMSQEELANSVGISYQQLYKYEKGINRISVSRLVLIARALGIPPASLLPTEEIPGVLKAAVAKTRPRPKSPGDA